MKFMFFFSFFLKLLGDVEVFKKLLLRQNASVKLTKAKKIDRAKSRSPVKRDEPEIPSICLSDNSEQYVDEFDAIYVPTSDLEVIFIHFIALVKWFLILIVLTFSQEFGDSLTDEKRKRKGRKKKSKSKNEKFIKPTGTLGLAIKAIEDRDHDLVDDLIVKLRIEFANDENFFNQPVNEHSQTLLHYAVKHNLQEIVWYVCV